MNFKNVVSLKYKTAGIKLWRKQIFAQRKTSHFQGSCDYRREIGNICYISHNCWLVETRHFAVEAGLRKIWLKMIVLYKNWIVGNAFSNLDSNS